jgi:hypothetical protein
MQQTFGQSASAGYKVVQLAAYIDGDGYAARQPRQGQTDVCGTL